MSDIIRLLPDHIANQIAAGEVIQRPASVVKELIENAIDANATHIDVIIKDAGKTLIQVIDNGKGMSEMDSRMAFERHATSKVQHADDLFALKTKGFRGEALASIAAIAHVELKTKQPDQEWGTSIKIEGSSVVEQTPCTCKFGSSFEVKNLFYNVPARRNFLKSDTVEFKHIEEEFIRIALAHPAIQFTLHHNSSICFHLAEANLRKRIVDIFGRSYNDKLVPIEEETGIVSLSGFIGKPEAAKKTRGEQYFFVNNRFFKDSFFNHALTQAYEGLLAPKTFPSYFLFFEVDPAAIDVNVHPTKTEIKFEEDREIYAILKSAVRQALGKFNITPALDFERETSFDLPYAMKDQLPVEPEIRVNKNYNPFSPSGSGVKSGHSKAIQDAGFGNLRANRSEWESFYSIEEEEETTPTTEVLFEKDEIQENTVIRHFFYTKKYLVCQLDAGIIYIHAKRALERVQYDELMQTFIIKPIHKQTLLFPVIFEISPQEKHFWIENEITLVRLGFEWELAEHELHVLAVPSHLQEEAISFAIQQIQQNLVNTNIEKGEIAHEIISSIASASAKQTKHWNLESVNLLYSKLLASSDSNYSPKGKQLFYYITHEELETKFT
jgi:DNA mismatch repair protein MutL